MVQNCIKSQSFVWCKKDPFENTCFVFKRLYECTVWAPLYSCEKDASESKKKRTIAFRNCNIYL